MANLSGLAAGSRVINHVVPGWRMKPRVLDSVLISLLLVSGLTSRGQARTSLPGAAQSESQPNATRLKVTHYDIQAELFPATHMLRAKVHVDFVPQTDLASASFRLNSALKVKRAEEPSGKEIQFKQDGLNLTLTPSSPFARDKTDSVIVEYAGALASAEGSPVEDLKLAYIAPEGSYLLYPACWFPVNGPGTDRFSATLKIKVPTDETVIASGKPSAPVRAADGTTYAFQYDKPSFPGTVIAGKYVVQPATAVGADITTYLKPGHEKFSGPYGETAAKALTFFSDKFGSLPSGHLAVVEIDDGTVGGYSAPGLVALASRGLTTPVNQKLVAHEVSHQWWRCLVSPSSPDDAFLDEGLATYSAALFVEATAGEAAFEDTMHQIAIEALTHEDAAPIAQASRLHEYTPEYNSIVYNKGAMVFHMLRWVIGDDAYLKTMRTLTQQYAWKTLSTRDFQKAAEQASNQQLTYFFAQWVDSTGVPQFKRTWAVYRTQNGYQVIGKIQQDLDIFRMPVEIRVYPEYHQPVNERIEMVGTTADFTINTPARPLKVVIDPASRILKMDDQTKTAVLMARADQLVQQQALLEAIKEYQKVLEINKNSSLAHYRIGETLFKLHNYNAAMEEFRAALNGDLEPKWVEVWSHLNIGRIFDLTGQRDRALNEYQKALQTNDNTQGALELANKYTQKPYTEDTRQAATGSGS